MRGIWGTLGSGGVAPLDHRLQAGIPSGWVGSGEIAHRSPAAIRNEIAAPATADAGGIGAFSRWLSAATPPERKSKPNATPAGVVDEITALDAESAEVLGNLMALL